jgi:hypothetical protein
VTRYRFHHRFEARLEPFLALFSVGPRQAARQLRSGVIPQDITGNGFMQTGVYRNRTDRELLSNPPLVLKTRPGTSHGHTPRRTRFGAIGMPDSRCRSPGLLNLPRLGKPDKGRPAAMSANHASRAGARTSASRLFVEK